MSPTDTLPRDVIRRFAEDERACFLMTYPGEGLLWPPDGDPRGVLSRMAPQLRIAWVNRRYLEVYAFPRQRSPLGWNMGRLVGRADAVEGVLRGFYDAGGHTHARLLRRRQDGTIAMLDGEYHVIEANGRILGHYGLEEDITSTLVAVPDDALDN